MALSCLRRREPELDPHSAYPRYFRSIRMDVPDDFPQDMTPHEFHLLRMNHFEHLILDKTTSEIRLVRIEKSTDDAAPIMLTLKHAILNTNLKFTALSYVWGTDASAYPVIIRDTNSEGYFPIKRNLWTFFLEARKSTADWSNEWFWVDQVCIDQANNKERCHQVNQMGLLYSTAQTTISWLTSDVNVLWMGLETTNLIPNPQELEDIQHKHCEQTSSHTSCNLSNSAMRLIESFSIEMLSLIVRSSYWLRLWVIQEIVLSPHSCVLLANELWDLDDLHNALHVIHDHMKHIGIMTFHESSRFLHVMRHITRYMLLRQYRRMSGQKVVNWTYVLELNDLAECSVPFDRVYALMGLLPEELRLEPDYTISSNQLIKNLLEKQVTIVYTRLDSIRSTLLLTLIYCKDCLKLGFIEPPGWVDAWSVPDRPEYRNVIKRIQTNNCRLVLRNLGLPDPFEVDTTDHKPDEMDRDTFNEIAEAYGLSQEHWSRLEKETVWFTEALTLQQRLLSEDT